MKNFWSSSKFDQMTNHKVCVCVNEWWWSRKPKRYRNWIVNFYFHFLLNFATIHIIFMLVFFLFLSAAVFVFFFRFVLPIYQRWWWWWSYLHSIPTDDNFNPLFITFVVYLFFFGIFSLFFWQKKIVKKFPHTPKKIKML